MPYLSSLMTQYGLATQYYANTHPSIGNYFMLTTGQILTNNDSETPSSFPVSVDNVVRELVAARKTWKAYAESLPSVGYLGGNTTSGGGQYYVRHVPIAYLTASRIPPPNSRTWCLFPNWPRISPQEASPTTPSSRLTVAMMPTIAASAPPTTGSKNNIGPLIRNSLFQKDGLLIVVFDESGNDNSNGGGRVVCTLISPAFCKLGYQSTTLYQHESVLRLTLEGLGVTLLPGAASNAPDMGQFFAH
jgi:acid phosphatase